MNSTLGIPCLFAALIWFSHPVTAQTPPQAARQYTNAHKPELTKQFSDLLAIPNVAADPANLQRNADLLVGELKKRGADAQLLSVPNSPPVVYGELKAPGAQRTIVFYAHYHGQPVTRTEWRNPPFSPIVRDLESSSEPRPNFGTVFPDFSPG